MSTTVESLELKISSDSTQAAKGIEALTQSLAKLKSATKGDLGLSSITKQLGDVSASTKKASSSFANIVSKVKMVAKGIYTAVTTIKQFTDKSSEYNETVHLFSVSMGQYAESAYEYASKVSSVMGIDISDWMKSQGIFMTLATGFGVAGDRASTMSQQLTQLGYDIASFQNISVEDAMTKLKSGLAGELEPLRAIGYDLSQAKLESVAEELGIDKAVADMTQAEKAQLRYYAIMTQVDMMHGDMAETLEQPANQMKILKARFAETSRAIGNVFMPALKAILPYAIAVTKVIGDMANSLASFLGYEMPKVESSGAESMSSAAESTATAMEESTKSAKKLKSAMLGIDELNVISPDTEDTVDDLTSSGFDFELPTYDFLGNASNEKVEGITAKIKEMLQPMKDLIDTTVEWGKALDFKPMKKSLEKIGSSLERVGTKIGEIWGWCYTEVFLPIAEWAIENGIPAALEAISGALDSVYEAMTPVFEGTKEIKPVLDPIGAWLGEVFIMVINAVRDAFDKLAQVFSDKGETIKGIITGLGEIISVVWGILKPILDVIVPWVKTALTFISDLLAEKVKYIIGVISGIVNFVAGVFTGDWDRAWGGIKEIFNAFWEYIKNVVVLAWNFIGDTIVAAWNAIVALFSSVGKWFYDVVIVPVGNFFKGLWETIAGFFVSLWNDIVGIWNTVATWFNDNVVVPVVDFFKGIWTSVSQFFSDLWNDIVGIWTSVSTWFNDNVVTPVIDFFKGIWTSVSGFFSQLWDDIVGIWTSVSTWFDENVVSPISAFFEGVTTRIGQFFEGCWIIIRAVWLIVSTWFNDNVITPIADFFKGLWESVSSFFSQLWTDIVAIWTLVSTWFNDNVIIPVVGFFEGVWTSVSSFFSQLWEDIVAIWSLASTWFNDNVIVPIVGFFEGVWTSVSGFFSELWEKICEIWEIAPRWFDEEIVTPVVNFFKGIWTSVSGFFSSLWEDIKKVWETVSTWFEDTIIEPVKKAFKDACEAIGKFFSDLWLSIRQGVVGAMNGVIGGIESAINWVVGGINNLIGGFNKVVQWAADIIGEDWGGVTLIQEVKFNRIAVPTYAEGGFPEQGQMFIAREAGAEMVGNIGRKTAVANNDQIVSGIAGGVAQANEEQNTLLREQNSLLRALLEKDSGVYLDGKNLTNSVEKYQRERGRVLITGGVL